MRPKTLFIHIIFFFVWACPAFAESVPDVDYGLTFRSHGFNLDERTGLNLSSDGHFRFRKGFSLEFDMRVNSDEARYGYVFRVISGNRSIDMLSNVISGHFNLVLSDGFQAVGKIDFNAMPLTPETGWHHVRLDVSRDGIMCSIDSVGQKMEATLPDLGDIDIRFGWNDHPVFYTTDVLSVSVREVRLADSRGIRYYWQLLRHGDGEVLDLICGRRAEVRNGIWNIDSHCEWTYVSGMRLHSGAPLIACDRLSSRMFVVTEDSLHICSLEDGTVLSSVKVSGRPVLNAGNQMIYDSRNDRLVCYSMHGDDLAYYDFGTSSWKGSFEEPWPPIFGSSRWLDADSGLLYVFGGYGNHRYNANLVITDICGGRRSVVDISDRIYPRYFCAMCQGKDGRLVVLGGYGNRSGLQEESPGALNDIFLIDRETCGCDSLGTFSWDRDPMIFASSMIYSHASDEVYALAFSNNRFKSSLNLVSCAPGRTVVGHSSPIPFCFHDTDSYADLVFSRDSSKFYAIVLNTRVNGANELKVYSLSYPPVPLEDIMQEKDSRTSRYRWFAVAAVLSCAVLALAAAFILMRRRKKPAAVLPPVAVENEDKPVFYSISLLGGLKIYDRERNDVTSKLTPMLRQLFLYFLLRAFSSGKAVTADELNEIFWFGMEKSVASNNRNVNMRKLRVILQEIGDISLVFNNDIITMELGDDIRCDYMEMMSLMKSMESSEQDRYALFAEFLKVAGRGTLLSGYEYEWLDKYKSEYAEQLISVMMKMAADPAVSCDSGYMLRIADCILREDCLDEFAVRTKCRLLYKLGHKGLSRQVYDKWCSDYRKMMDSEPEISYKSMIS